MFSVGNSRLAEVHACRSEKVSHHQIHIRLQVGFAHIVQTNAVLASLTAATTTASGNVGDLHARNRKSSFLVALTTTAAPTATATATAVLTANIKAKRGNTFQP